MVTGYYAPKDAEFLKKLFRKSAEIGERRAEAKVRPYVGEVQKTVAGTEFVRGLRQSGLPAEIVEDPDFQNHLKETRSRYRSFSTLERSDPTAAAALAASTWKDRNGRRADFARERQRVEDSKASSLNARGSRPSQTAASETTEVPYSSGMRGILDAVRRGVPAERIRFAGKKR